MGTLPQLLLNVIQNSLWRTLVIREELEKLLEDIRKARIAVIGDFCLDAYWFIDMSTSELSLETGKSTQPVNQQHYSLGGAGNIVNNLVDLGVGTVVPVGVIGNDPWGREMVRILESKGVDTGSIQTQNENWATMVYAKPHVADIEQNRIDFGNFNRLSGEIASALIDRLESLIPDLDVIIVNQQVSQGIHTDTLRKKLADLIKSQARKIFIVDSRHHSEAFPGAYLKINDHEAVRLCGITRKPEEAVPKPEATRAAEQLFKRFGKPTFVTRGSRGCLVRDRHGLHEIPGPHVLGRTDTVGAGDSMLVGIAAALAVNRTPFTAAELGSCVAAVTIQKLHCTGTATPDEVLKVGVEPDYVYRPELADDSRRAHYLPGTEFEVITEIPDNLSITHAIFDHDGTVSTLRQGWEKVMEPMMIRAILGENFESADESLYQRVVEIVRTYIEQSTGVQTLVQMKELVSLVREFGYVQEKEILDEFGYKKIYNEHLMRIVGDRLARLRRGELSVEDFTIKNAPKLLRVLYDLNVKLYLASGTDEEDVVTEAAALGYADLFEGRIYGAIGDITKEAKRIVVQRILSDIGKESASSIVVFGDGPVEIRETRKQGGFAVGVASDELRRFGLDISKRSRLIKAGADLLIPDFSQMDKLLELFFFVRRHEKNKEAACPTRRSTDQLSG